MTKIIRSINIEEDIWTEAKAKFPNLSQFIEDLLQTALHSQNNDEIKLRHEKIQLEQTLLTLQTKINTIDAQLSNIQSGNQSKEEKQQKIWQTIILQQYSSHMINSSLLKEASEILGYPAETLEKTATEVVSRKNDQLETGENMKKWDYVKQNYLE